jgi:hypothetical protein
VVGVIDNGRSGYANPHAKCDGCGAIGQFHFAPGVHADAAAQASTLVLRGAARAFSTPLNQMPEH